MRSLVCGVCVFEALPLCWHARTDEQDTCGCLSVGATSPWRPQTMTQENAHSIPTIRPERVPCVCMHACVRVCMCACERALTSL